MKTNAFEFAYQAQLTPEQFSLLKDFIHQRCGIVIADQKKVLLEARLRSRLKVLSMNTFDDYLSFLFHKESAEGELVEFINEVTTNKTDFFREADHFEYLFKEALPELVQAYGSGIARKLRVWSAGCSTGEEPYTLSMILYEIKKHYSKFDYFILATDISTKVLSVARKAIYEKTQVNPVPLPLKKKYLLKGKTGTERLHQVRIVPALRSRVNFRRLNFLQGDFGLREKMDVIFCRNVLIYFDRKTREKVLARLANHLEPGGYLFMGHSETMAGANIPLKRITPTIYRKL